MPKHHGPQTHTHINKKLHNLFPMSVHSLLSKRNYQCSSLHQLASGTLPIIASTPITCANVNNFPKQPPLARQMNDMLSNAAQISFTNILC